MGTSFGQKLSNGARSFQQYRSHTGLFPGQDNPSMMLVRYEQNLAEKQMKHCWKQSYLNPIEGLWYRLKTLVRMRYPCNKKGLIEDITVSWNHVIKKIKLKAIFI
ncbi:UNVERIFIED_CONTAM: hypothetical protein NCL1_30864 [Trichonephila clavipes]